jgi:hypothetical protein
MLYISKSHSHQHFVQQLLQEKVLMQLFLQQQDVLFQAYYQNFFNHDDKSDQVNMEFEPNDDNYKPNSITKDELNLLSPEPSDLQNLLFSRIYSNVYKLFVYFLVDFYNELSSKNETIPSKVHLTYKHKRTKAYDNIHLPIIPPEGISDYSANKLQNQLDLLESIRHILEHNRGLVDEKFKEQHPETEFEAGSRIKIGVKETAHAINLVQILAESLDQRAVMMGYL